MKSNKNALKIISLSVISLILIAVCAYLAYGSTLLNPDSDKSVINILSTDKSNPIDILKIEKYKNYVAVLYTDPTDEKLHFAYFEKSHYYSDRYLIKGGGSTNNGVDCTKVQNDSKEMIFFIYNDAEEESVCSVFEVTSELIISKKIEEIDTPEGAFIIVKEYDLEDKNSEVIVFDGSLTLEEANQYF